MKKKPTPVCQKVELDNCFSCKVVAGKIHKNRCDIERCSVCGGQYVSCKCEQHDKQFAYWNGFSPEFLISKALNLDINTFYLIGMHKIFFVKPKK
jgi:hypothetical protein